MKSSGTIKFYRRRIFSRKLISAVITIAVIILLFSGCRAGTDLPELSFRYEQAGKDYKANSDGILRVITQNTMLIPFSFVAPAYPQRTFCLIEMVLDNYDIACLQEVFAGGSQNQIISAWHDDIYNNMNNNTTGVWQYDFFMDWYGNLQDSVDKPWLPLTSAKDVSELAEKESYMGIRVIDCKPNSRDARIVFSPYYVMGPENSGLPFQQDGGLVILSRYPIIACSAFSFDKRSGSDILANKGVLYARIKIGPSAEDYIHVFDTHLQSHEYAETRQENMKELLDFVAEIIKPEEPDYRPIMIMGDFNVDSDVYSDNWMELSGIISPPDEYEEKDNPDFITEPSKEYEEFCDKIKDFEESDPEGEIYLQDTWLYLKKDDPGFTWIGKDWITGTESSYGDLGNRVAIETGSPQRIDYIFYFGGSGYVNINPESIYLIPKEPKILYCYDMKHRWDLLPYSNECIKIDEGKDMDCSFKSYTVSDHLGLEANFNFEVTR